MIKMRLDSMKLDEFFENRQSPSGPPRRTARYGWQDTRVSFLAYLRQNMLLCIMAGLFLAGLLMGTLLVGNASENTRHALEVILGGYLEKRQTQSFFAIAVSSFSSTAIALLVLFFCGFCSISQVIIVALPFLKGLGYGFSLGAFYLQYGMQAAPYVLFVLLPGIVCSMLLLFYACKTSFLLSIRLLRAAITPSDKSERMRMQRYCIKYAFFTTVCAASAFLDACLFYQLSALFVL